MGRPPWWGDGSAKGAASQVGLEGRGGSGHSGATAGSEWRDIRCVLWSELSGLGPGVGVGAGVGPGAGTQGAEGTIQTRTRTPEVERVVGGAVWG